MENFQFAQILLTKRQELHLTQEDIAKYVGVTRAAVSKWEKGLSYPDITLLPKLATFFNVSIDTLLGYEPQMTKERIEQLYMEFAEKFATEPFEQVRQQLNQVKQEYYSCYPLLLKIVQLYINYVAKAENKLAVYQEAFELADRVRTQGNDISFVQEAIALQGFIQLMQGNAEEALDLVGRELTLEYGVEQLIISAYSMQGNVEKAKEIAQVAMFQKLLVFVSISTETLLMTVDRPHYFEETVKKVSTLITLYNMPNLQVNTAFVFYLKAAMGFVMLGRHEEALDMIEHYVQTCESLSFPLKLQGDEYFFKVNDWLKQQSQLMMQAPRDEQSIKQDLINTIISNPAFAPLHEQSRYEQLVRRLKTLFSEGEEM